MFKLLKSKHQSILGIDLSSTSVRILELSLSGSTHTVEGYGHALLPEKAMEGNVVKDIGKVAGVIKNILSTFSFSSRQAVIAVPDASTISKIIQLDAQMSDVEMEELILSEADKYIPYPIDEVNLDFNILGPSVKNPSLADVLIVASRAENVTNRVESIQQANLEVIIVDVESYAIERAAKLLAPSLPSGGEKKNIAIIDIGAMYMHIYVLHDMKIIYSHEEEFGGKQLIDSIMHHYNLKHSEASLALEEESLPQDYPTKVLQPYKELLLLQIKRALQFFFSTSNQSYLDYIVLSGGIAKIEGISQIVQENVNIPTMIANPLARMMFSSSVDQDLILKDSPKLMIACGLALREVSK